MAQIRNCNEIYDNEDPAGPFQWDKAKAYEACLAEAEASKTACEAGIGEDPRDEAWDHFDDHIEMCLQTFPDNEPEAQQACIASALDTYLDEIEEDVREIRARLRHADTEENETLSPDERQKLLDELDDLAAGHALDAGAEILRVPARALGG